MHEAGRVPCGISSRTVATLRSGIRAIGVDTPGFGESDPTPFVPTAEDWAAAIPAVLDHLGVARADVLGHHTGSMVAPEVALQFPDRVRRLGEFAGVCPRTRDRLCVPG